MTSWNQGGRQMDGKTLPGSEMVKVTGGCGLMKRVTKTKRKWDEISDVWSWQQPRRKMSEGRNYDLFLTQKTTFTKDMHPCAPLTGIRHTCNEVAKISNTWEFKWWLSRNCPAETLNIDRTWKLLQSEIFLNERKFKQKSVIHASEYRNEEHMRFEIWAGAETAVFPRWPVKRAGKHWVSCWQKVYRNW